MSIQESETIYYVVNNRILLLGLDNRYRTSMASFEFSFLLQQAETIATKLNVVEADVPVEGYYSESKTLTHYFKLMRALQKVSNSKRYLVNDMPEFQEILRVASSPIFGKPQFEEDILLPQGRDPLSQALNDVVLSAWNANKLINSAYEAVMESEDISLVGLAVRLKDQVAIAALKESVILYAEKLFRGMPNKLPRIEYIWKVDDDFATAANRFIEEFNGLLPKDNSIRRGIPKAEPQNARIFFHGFQDNKILGRCANLGYDRSSPKRFYHWAITKQNDELALDEFWDTKLWTTAEYKSKQEQVGWKFLKDELNK